MGFTTYYSALAHHLKFHLEELFQTPQGTSFNKPLGNWDKSYGYGNKYTKVILNQLITAVTTVDEKL